jgi:energy-coupling factor transporter ATP-binding protein EcfA2
VRAPLAGGAQGATRAPLPPSPADARGTGDQAAAVALRPLEWGEGARAGVLGDTGTGKTTATLRLISAYLRASPGLVVVVDGKPTSSPFARIGQERADLHDVIRRPVANEPRVIVLRSSSPNVSAIVTWCWAISRRRPVLLVLDELRVSTTGHRPGQRWAGPLADAFTQGRTSRFSIVWGSQSPQDCPREAFEQTGVILCSRIAGMGLRTLRDRGYTDGGAELVLPTLPGEDDPPADRGVFLALRRGRAWDGVRYKF